MSLIVIEGLDGSGKATQAAKLAARLRERGDTVRQVSFPNYESEAGRLIRRYLSGELGGLAEVNVYAVSSLYAVDRFASFSTDWKEDWLAGHTIVADRYTTSNAVHQMARLPEGEWKAYLDWLWDYEFTRMRLPEPRRVIYLDLDPQLSQLLLSRRYRGGEAAKDLHELDVAYQQTCRRAALFAADRLGWTIIDCSDGGENIRTVQEIAEDIWQTLDV